MECFTGCKKNKKQKTNVLLFETENNQMHPNREGAPWCETATLFSEILEPLLAAQINLASVAFTRHSFPSLRRVAKGSSPQLCAINKTAKHKLIKQCYGRKKYWFSIFLIDFVIMHLVLPEVKMEMLQIKQQFSVALNANKTIFLLHSMHSRQQLKQSE